MKVTARIAMSMVVVLQALPLYAQTDFSFLHDYAPTVPEIARVHGEVEALRVFRIEADAERIPVLSMDFHRTGAVASQTRYEQGRFRWRSSFSYDPGGRLVQWQSRNVEGSIEWVYEYSYDGSDIPVQVTERTGSGLVVGVRNINHRDGAVEEQTQFDGSGRLQWTRHYDQIQSHLMQTWTLLFPDGGIVKRVHSHFSPHGRLVREEHLDQNNALTEVIRHAYDAYGRVRLTEVFDPDGDVRRRIERRYCENGWLHFERRYEAADNVTTTRTLEYTTDMLGNWIQRSEHVQVVQSGTSLRTETQVLERQIRYF